MYRLTVHNQKDVTQDVKQEHERVLDMSKQGDQRNGRKGHLENQEAEVTMEKYLSPGQQVKKKRQKEN